MDVYSVQNLGRKNHIATITINYLKKIKSDFGLIKSDEDNLQHFVHQINC